MKITAIINKQDGQLYIEFRDECGILIDQKVVDEIKSTLKLKEADNA